MALESIKQITVDVTNSGTHNDSVTAMQGDNGTRYVYVTVLNNGQPADISNTYPVLRGTKSDGKTIFNQCTVYGDKVIIELTSQILASSGVGNYELAFYDRIPVEGENDGNVIASFPFVINVVKSSFDAVNVLSSDEYSVLNEAMINIPSIASIQDFEEMVDNLDSAFQAQIGSHVVESDVPANAEFTDTTYELASDLVDGLMKKTDYTKLSNIEYGAEVNQNAFDCILCGYTPVTAPRKSSVVTFYGTNIAITGDTSAKSITFEVNSSGIQNALGYIPASLDENGKIPVAELPSGIGSIVTASQINGNIVVDGNELPVYDYDSDTGLKNYIAAEINNAIVSAINGTY